MIAKMIPWQQKDPSFHTTNSETLNPENTRSYKRQLKQFEDEFDIVSITASRVKKRIQEETGIKWRERSRKGSIIQDFGFTPSKTISAMTRSRHLIQENTKKLENCKEFLTNKVKMETKKRINKELQKSRLQEFVVKNRSQKSLIKKTINNNRQQILKRKILSKQEVLGHRRSLQQTLKNDRIQRIQNVIQSKEDQKRNHNYIDTMKNTIILLNRESVLKGKSQEKKLKNNQIELISRKKRIATQNYKNKWLLQFQKNQKAEIKNKKKGLLLNKKIESLLNETKHLQKQKYFPQR